MGEFDEDGSDGVVGGVKSPQEASERSFECVSRAKGNDSIGIERISVVSIVGAVEFEPKEPMKVE